MSFASLLWKSTMGGVGRGFSMATGSAGGRALLGGVVGGLYAAATTDSVDTGHFMSSVFGGALTGAALGAGSRLITPALTKNGIKGPLAQKMLWNRSIDAGKVAGLARLSGRDALETYMKKNPKWAMRNISKGGGLLHPRTLASAGMNTASIVGRIGNFAIRHPWLTLAGGTTGTALLMQNSQPNSSPGIENASFQESAISMNTESLNNGISPTGGISGGMRSRSQTMLNSTYGLVQGLHQGRH